MALDSSSPVVVEYSTEFTIDSSPDIPNQVWVWTRKQDTTRCAEIVNVLSVSKDHQFVTVMKASVTEEEDTAEVETLPQEDTYMFDEAHLRDWDNVAQMNNLHEPALVELLRRRYAEDKIYTLSGDIIISINPYKDIPGLYEENVIFRKSDAQIQQELHRGEERSGKYLPHLFSTAESAYNALHASENNQSILVNGESGAGKTEAAKWIMRFLAWKSKKVSGATAVEETVLQSNPLLEAFGNAQTIRNDNSSRFGKFVKIEYSDTGVICCAKTQHFLLEKSRIVHHTKGERNYHIFYQMCQGLKDVTELGLSSASTFSILCPGEATTADVEGFSATIEALKSVGIGDKDVSSIWQVLAGILHLGNISFVPSKDDEEHAALNESDEMSVMSVKKSCELLGLSIKDLKNALVTRTLGGKQSVFTIPLSPRDAEHSRNALAKSIYSKLFDWLVSCVNKTSETMGTRFIGILDIFGFEILEVNSFEQLCVNFANEVLQKLFNEHVFELEQSRYEGEGIKWKFLSFTNNQELIDVLDGPRTSVLALLEEQGLLGTRASDENYLSQLVATFKENGSSLFIQDRFGGLQFTIKHFAGPVEYQVESFLSKNNDALQGDLSDLMVAKVKDNEFIQTNLFPQPKQPEITEETINDSPRRRRKMASLQSVSVRFRSQMNDLVGVLRATKIHFVRCVKPNDSKQPGVWDGPLVLNQLRHLGVMEAVRIRQEGYPVTRTFQAMVDAYGVLLASKDGKSPREACEALLLEAFGDADVVLANKHGGESCEKLWQFGEGKVFLNKKVLPELNVKIQEYEKELERIRKQKEKERLEREEAERKRLELEKLDQLERERLEKEEKERVEREEKERLERLAKEEKERLRKIKEKEEERLRLLKEEEEKEKERVRMEKELECKRLAEEELVKQLALEKLQHSIKNVTILQSWWRRRLDQDHFGRLKKARWPWRRVLEPNEAVLLASLVVHTSEREIVKKIGLTSKLFEGLLKSKKRRGLILTTKPRLLCVDPKKMVIMNERPVNEKSNVNVLSDKSFIVYNEGDDDDVVADNDEENGWSFTDILGRSAPWARAIKKPLTVAQLMHIGIALRLDSTEPVIQQGYLKKRAIKSAKNWRERWFVLQGNDLMWYKSQKQSSPQGTVIISDETSFQIHVNKDREHCFSVHAPTVPEGLFIQCPSKRVMLQWLASLTGVKATSRFYDEGVTI